MEGIDVAESAYCPGHLLLTLTIQQALATATSMLAYYRHPA